VTATLCLGKLAWDACWRVLALRGHPVPRPRPVFGHGAVVRLSDGFQVLGAYHPSRQNTHTGRLTPAMLADVFGAANRLLHA
jgi:uracil-DNA glycosylase